MNSECGIICKAKICLDDAKPTKVYVHAFQRVAGVKGTASLVALRRERNTLNYRIKLATIVKSLTAKKAQFTTKRENEI